MNNTLNLKQNIMRRVRFVYWTKRILRPIYLKAGVLSICLAAVASSVSVVSIARNFSHVNVGVALQFMVSAFVNTDFLVKILVIGIFVMALLLIRDIYSSLWAFRSLKTYRVRA